MSEGLKRTIGARVKNLREHLPDTTSQEDLARELSASGHDVTQAQIGHIEAARRLPSVELFVALAEYFGTSLDYMAGRTELQSSLAAIEEDLQTGGISGRLGETYRALPAERQAEVYWFAQAQGLLAQNEMGILPNGTRASASRFGESLPSVGANQKAIGAIFAVMKKRMAQEDVNEIVDEVLALVPAWYDLIDQYRESSTKKPPSKDSGLKG